MSELYELERGDAPLLVSIPHLGTHIPGGMRPLYSDAALTLVDTDWHLDTLYAFAREMGATILGAKLSRYVVDLNRPPSDESLYPGQTTIGLCPTETFRGEPVYRQGCEPDDAEKRRRVQVYYRPYHETLQTELVRLRTKHPHVLLWEAHSIASVLPRLFDNKLPDLSLGTQDGRTAAHAVQAAAEASAAAGCVHMGGQWPLQGRPYHPSFRSPATGHPRHPA